MRRLHLGRGVQPSEDPMPEKIGAVSNEHFHLLASIGSIQGSLSRMDMHVGE